jgi:ketosteroid isomerase-like protein
MHKTLSTTVILIALSLNIFASNDLQKLFDTERAFAKEAADRNTRQAFIDFAAPDGVIFNPTVLNAQAFWEKRAVSSSLLEWKPAYGDVNADGSAGWDLGPWQYRPKGKDDKPVAFGHFSTFWVKQPDGNFRFAVDMGIGYEKSGYDESDAKSPADAGKGGRASADPFTTFNTLFAAQNWSRSYQAALADDCYMLRDNKPVIRGKKDAIAELDARDSAADETDKTSVNIIGRHVYGNFAYVFGEISATKTDKTARRQNFFQVWKFRSGGWQIVLDVQNDIG